MSAIPGSDLTIRAPGNANGSSAIRRDLVREACLEYVPDAHIGQYVLVHVGFAISCGS